MDADIQRILAAAATDADQAAARRLLDQLAAYREVAWQAIAVERESPSTAPGVLPPAARGYYAQATNILHFELLPTAKQLRESSQAALERSYADERTTAVPGHRRRVVSPYYLTDFRNKSNCVISGGSCGSGADDLGGSLSHGAGLTPAQPKELTDRWESYRRDHEQVVALADAGQVGPAIDLLTGIRRGAAAFDFYYYDRGVSDIAAGRRQAFDNAMARARGELSGWPWIPIVLMSAVIVLAWFGTRARLAEYR